MVCQVTRTSIQAGVYEAMMNNVSRLPTTILQPPILLELLATAEGPRTPGSSLAIQPVVVDTNILLGDIRHRLRSGRETALIEAPQVGTLRPFVARHILGEVARHLPSFAIKRMATWPGLTSARPRRWVDLLHGRAAARGDQARRAPTSGRHDRRRRVGARGGADLRRTRPRSRVVRAAVRGAPRASPASSCRSSTSSTPASRPT